MLYSPGRQCPHWLRPAGPQPAVLSAAAGPWTPWEFFLLLLLLGMAACLLSLFTALWAVLLLEADERLLAGRWGCWDSGDLELGGPPTRPCPSTHPFKHRPPTTPGAAPAPVFHLSSHNNPEPHHH